MFRNTLVLILFLSSATLRANDWPQFRGPKSDGHYFGKTLPIEWGPNKNVAWKTPIPGHGWSSPIVWKDCVYLTTAIEEEQGNRSLRALCLDAKTGKILWNIEVFKQIGKDAPNVHSKNSHASSTPVTDGERLYVHFGHQGTAALHFQGKILWQKKYTYVPVHGNGGSPIVVDNKLVFNCDGADKQFVVALDTKTGKEIWKRDRNANPSKGFSFGTPQLLTTGKRTQIISSASNVIAGYDPQSGKELWRCKYEGYSLIPQPIVGNGLIYYSTGYNTPSLQALLPEGSGDITSKVQWTAKRDAPNTPTPLLVEEELYMVSDRGTMTCLDAKNGKVIWSERLPGGGYSSSPIYADGKIYITNEIGIGIVVQAGKEFKTLAKNDLKEKTFATFAAADGGLFVRTETMMYRFEEK
jgi:outer membrane protein assembly factor BamB